jgi:transglutaminase-like putative cysteine protease
MLEAVKRANRPGPPEHSIGLRVACGGAVLTGIGACRAEGELSWSVAVGAAALVSLGMVVSYRTRRRPLPWIKPILAVVALAAFVWFFRQLTGQGVYDVNTVENPLAVLFVWVQVAHAFDVPARRDLSFSLAGSASLMAVAAAQAIDLSFGVYVLGWAVFGLAGLLAMWSSASQGGRIRPVEVAGALGAVGVVAVGVLVVLPAPQVAGRIDFPANAGPGAQLGVPGALAGDGGRVLEPARAGSPTGLTRVGGYLGFANRLDTALRGSLGDTVVMRVRAQRPSFWVGETFDQWDGQSWKATTAVTHPSGSGSPFFIFRPTESPPTGPPDLQTFFIVQPSPNLVFHADTAREVWFPARSLFTSAADSIVSPIGLGPGAIYSVESALQAPTPGELRTAPAAEPGEPPDTQGRYLQLPRAYAGPYARVQALARSITAHAPDTYGKVQALMGWIGAHTRYSTAIPPLAPGQDTVDDFLFGARTGFCEQISTSLNVMLRSLGIPAREAVGYVPGPYNPITDLYDVQASDAHAWVQVWFAGYGWVSFDPTAVVPAANPSPGATLLHDAAHELGRLPWAALGAALGAMAIVMATARWRRRRPRTWADHVAMRIEAAGRRAGRRRAPNETLAEYAAALDAQAGDASGTWRALAEVVEASAYGRRHPPPEDGRRLLRSLRGGGPIGPRPAAGRGTGIRPEPGRAPRRSSPPARAGRGTP